MSSRKPPLYDTHAESGADFTDFGGWKMPVSFDSIQKEHRAVRENAGIFDVSHMGQIAISGKDAADLLHLLTTENVRELSTGEAQYSCLLRSDGVILDDLITYNHPTKEEYLVVPNAGHDEEVLARAREYAHRHDFEVEIRNRTEATGMVAVQGPDAVSHVEAATDEAIAELDPFTVCETTIGQVRCLVARTGYTGEDGFEIVFPAEESAGVHAHFADVIQCGLGARDTLRLEAGLLLSGQDFHPIEEPRTPLEANLSFAVDMEKDDFVGKAVLESQRPEQYLVGLELKERAIARHGHEISNGSSQVGHVTSGTMSPTLNVPIAMGYIDSDYAEPGTELNVSVRGREATATVVQKPFLESIEL